jgi:hypothetical protein
MRLGRWFSYRLVGSWLGHLLNYRLGFEDRSALAKLALADRVDAVGCGGFGRLILGGRRGSSRNAEVGAFFGTMACLRLGAT